MESLASKSFLLLWVYQPVNHSCLSCFCLRSARASRNLTSEMPLPSQSPWHLQHDFTYLILCSAILIQHILIFRFGKTKEDGKSFTKEFTSWKEEQCLEKLNPWLKLLVSPDAKNLNLFAVACPTTVGLWNSQDHRHGSPSPGNLYHRKPKPCMKTTVGCSSILLSCKVLYLLLVLG